jgi:hypothetical protein
MTFKKFRGQIFDVELTAKEQKAMDDKINSILMERYKKLLIDIVYEVMRILHNHLGLGRIRLRRVFNLIEDDIVALEKHYEMVDAGLYIARKEMNAIGVNIEQWLEERGE